MYNLLVFLSFLQSVMGFTLMSSSTMLFREPMRKRIVAGFLVMLLGIIILSYTLFTKGFHAVDRYAVLVILLIELSWFLICSEDRFFVSLFSFLTYVNIYVSISYISDNIAVPYSENAFVGARIVIRLVIYALLLPFLFNIVRKHFRGLVDTLDKEWRVASLVPLMFLAMQIMVLYYPTPYWYWNNGSWSRVIIFTLYLLFMAVYYLLSIQASAIVEKYALEKRHLLMAQQEKLWESELIRQKATAELAFQQKHDMHHHNAVIVGLLQSGDSKRLMDYMKSFDTALDAQYTKSFCMNPIANSIISLYATRAEEEKIRISFHVAVPEKIAIDNIDLTCVLGNALENALEGCLRLPEQVEKEIMLTMKYFDKRLRILVENTCESDIAFHGELPMTKKTGGGTGTKSILYTAERYDGTAGFTMMNNRFMTQIVLNAR